jgi:YidC/Oxa1 family membrane protein insertase
MQTGQSVRDLLNQSDYGHYKGYFTNHIANAVILFLVNVYAALGNFGIGIILAAILVRTLMLNLTIAQVRMMRIQQYLNPLQKRINERYKGDKQAQNKMLMEIYSKFKLNPMASCLAMFIQIPIFFGVYRALYDKILLGKTFFGMQLLFPMNLYYARTYGGVNLSKQIMAYIAEHQMQSQVWAWTWNLGGKDYSWALYWPALLLVVLYVASTLWLQKMMRKMSEPDAELKAVLDAQKKPRAKDDKPPAPDMAEQMQKNMRFFSIFMVVIAFVLSTGALLYFFVQNLLMVAEYVFIPRVLKLSISAAEVSVALEAIDKGRSLIEKPEDAQAQAPEEEGIAQAPLRKSQARGFKKK